MASHRVNRFSEDVKIVKVLNYANGTSDRTSEVIDTAGFNRCCVVVDFATIAAGVTESIRLTHSDVADDENTLNGGVNCSGTAQTVAADDDDEPKYIDFEPGKRFYQLVIDKDATNASAESAIAYLYNPTSGQPVTHGDGTTTIGEGTEPVTGEAHGMLMTGTP